MMIDIYEVYLDQKETIVIAWWWGIFHFSHGQIVQDLLHSLKMGPRARCGWLTLEVEKKYRGVVAKDCQNSLRNFAKNFWKSWEKFYSTWLLKRKLCPTGGDSILFALISFSTAPSFFVEGTIPLKAFVLVLSGRTMSCGLGAATGTNGWETGCLSLTRYCPVEEEEGLGLESFWKEWPGGRWQEYLVLGGWRESKIYWCESDLGGRTEDEVFFLAALFLFSHSSKTRDIIFTCFFSVAFFHPRTLWAFGPKRSWPPCDMTLSRSWWCWVRSTGGDSKTACLQSICRRV